MARIKWGEPGSRYFESGVDRGVLYPLGESGVPWSGLVSVKENYSGGGPRPYYYEGVKYANLAEAEEYEATIEAYHAPRKLAECLGIAEISNGLFVTQQTKRPFGFSYRTHIGNDVDGETHTYKVHMVYNALGVQDGTTNQTLSSSPSAPTLSWSISTVPHRLPGVRPSAHFVADTRYASLTALTELEDLLYGSEESDSRLPTPSELISIFS